MKKRFRFLSVILLGLSLTLVTSCNQAQLLNYSIGLSLCLTGSLSNYGQHFQEVAEMLKEHINEQGGFADGGKLEYVIRDDGTNPNQANQVDTDLVNNAKVAAIMGHCSSGATIPGASISIPAKVVLMSPSATSPRVTEINDNDFVFRTAPSDALQGVLLAKLAYDKGYKKISIIARNDAYGGGLATEMKNAFERLGGQVAKVTLYEESVTDYTAQITEASQDKPDAISIISFQEVQALLIQMVKAGVTNFDLFADGTKDQTNFDELAKVIDPELLKDKTGSAPASAQTDGSAKFESLYKAYRVKKNQPQEEVFVYTGNTYDAIFLLALAMQKAALDQKKLSGETIRDSLRAVANSPGEIIGVGDWKKAVELLKQGKDINYEGASGAVDFDKHGDVLSPARIWSLVNGKITEGALCQIEQQSSGAFAVTGCQ
jgi:ABC-type branched-subunit amino acid transport system substrate-binding protein